MGNLFKPQKLTTTQNASTTALQPYADAYQQLLQQGLNLGHTAYNPATNASVAGFSNAQNQAFQGVQNMQGAYLPFMDAATQSALTGAAPSYANVGQYMNPYDQYVTGSLMNDYDQMIGRNRQMNMADAAKAGALTGDRRYIAQSVGQEGLDRTVASNLANVRQQGYTQALGAAQNDALRQLQASGVLSGLGGLAQQYGYNDVNAMLGIGGMQQAQQQKELDTATQNAKQQEAYPFELAQWLSQYATGLGGAAGSQSSGKTTQPGPSWGQQILGAIAAGAGAYAKSDARIKHNIEEIGSTHDGQPIYRYRLEDSPKTEIGLLAQNVEKTHPEAVSSLGGIKHVNYKTATEDSVRGKYALGGGMPYGGGLSYVPQIQIQQKGLPAAQFVTPAPRESGMSKILENFNAAHGTLSGLGKLGEYIDTPISSSKDPASGFETTTSKSGWSPFFQNLYNQAGDYLGGLGSGISSSLGGLASYIPTFNHGGVVRHGYQFGGGLTGLSPFDYYSSYVPDNSDMAKREQLPVAEAPEPQPIQTASTDNSSFSTFVEPSGLGGLSKDTTESTNSEESKGGLFGFKMSPEAADALMAAGFGMMASNSPFVGQAIGEGGLAGMLAYQRAKKLKQEQEQGMVKEIDGKLVRLLPNNKVETIYESNKSPYSDLKQMPDGSVVGFRRDNGKPEVVYGGGGMSDKNPAGRAELAKSLGLDAEQTKMYVATGTIPQASKQLVTLYDAEGNAKTVQTLPSGEYIETKLPPGYTNDPLLAKELNEKNKLKVKAQGALPDAQGDAAIFLKNIDDLMQAPGLSRVTGMVAGRTPNLSGDAANAQSLIEQLKNESFLQAYNSLRGAGGISEAESGKATGAVGRFENQTVSTTDYQKALKDAREFILRGVIKARVKAGKLPEGSEFKNYDFDAFVKKSNELGYYDFDRLGTDEFLKAKGSKKTKTLTPEEPKPNPASKREEELVDGFGITPSFYSP